MTRVRRFVRWAYKGRRHWLRSPIIWHNLRALWVQSDPTWLLKAEQVVIGDNEYDEYEEAFQEAIHADHDPDHP
jgi:hypothetical protein